MNINKTMEPLDLSCPEAKVIINELNDLITDIKGRGLKISSWYGEFNLSNHKGCHHMLARGYNYKPLEGAADDINFPWFLYWEIIWILMNTEFKKGQRILDMGGSSSLFSFYIASKGFEVVTIDLQEHLVDNANYVAKEMNWNMKNYVMDIMELEFDQKFDHITSICVFEHIPIYNRVKINKGIAELLADSGHLSITFDYRNPCHGAMIDTPQDIEYQFVKSSGLTVRGNPIFVDTGNSYLLTVMYHRGCSTDAIRQMIVDKNYPLRDILKFKDSCDYTFGALFLEK